jgi:RNA polymerase sigma-32 factor
MVHIDDPQTQKANLRYFKSVMRAPMLERETEFDLARRWRDDADEAALHQLVQAYARLVVSAATKFRNYGLPIGDLVQEGNIGLMQAAARFDPERNVRFSTYATWWIRSAMQDYILRNWSIVRTGTTAAQKSLFFNLRRLRAKIEKPSATQMSDTNRRYIANQLKVSINDVESMENRLVAGDKSLNAPISEEGSGDWMEFLPDLAPTPESATVTLKSMEIRSQWLHEALDTLGPREQLIIKRRRLRDDGDTLEQLGRRLGVSKERVRQLENRALSKIRDLLAHKTSTISDLLVDAQ